MRPINKFRGNIFVANLPTDYTDEQLAQAFDPFGLVLGAFIARDPITRASKGYGLVNLAPDRVAKEAAAAVNGKQIDGRTVEARVADPNMAITVPTQRRSPARAVYDLPMPAAPRRPVIVEYRRPRIGVGR